LNASNAKKQPTSGSRCAMLARTLINTHRR
jgi:hypothetical protein